MYNLQSLKITDKLLQFPQKIEEHFLAGYYYKYLGQNQFKANWEKNYVSNQTRLEFLKSLGTFVKQKNLKVAILKGFALLPLLYSDLGSRFMSDIDLLLAEEDLDIMERLLLDNGFELLSTQKWERNNFKREYMTKEKNSFSIVIETHSKLFHHRDKQFSWKFENHTIYPFLQLTKEGMLNHLIGHLAFQHTFVKLNWLFDIYLFVRKYQNEIVWEEVHSNAKELDLYRSHQMVFWILETTFFLTLDEKTRSFFKLDDSLLFKKIISNEFLIFEQADPFKYYVIKHLTKDSFIDALKYDCQWLKTRFLK